MAEVDTDTMYTIKDNSCIEHIIPITTDNDGGFDTAETLFFGRVLHARSVIHIILFILPNVAHVLLTLLQTSLRDRLSTEDIL